MVDCVMIDPADNGQVFNVVLSDVPEKKSDAGKTIVAVKVIDMLGEDVLVTQQV